MTEITKLLEEAEREHVVNCGVEDTLACRALTALRDETQRMSLKLDAVEAARDEYHAMLVDADKQIGKLREARIIEGWLPPEDARRSAQRWGEVTAHNRRMRAALEECRRLVDALSHGSAAGPLGRIDAALASGGCVECGSSEVQEPNGEPPICMPCWTKGGARQSLSQPPVPGAEPRLTIKIDGDQEPRRTRIVERPPETGPAGAEDEVTSNGGHYHRTPCYDPECLPSDLSPDAERLMHELADAYEMVKAHHEAYPCRDLGGPCGLCVVLAEVSPPAGWLNEERADTLRAERDAAIKERDEANKALKDLFAVSGEERDQLAAACAAMREALEVAMDRLEINRMRYRAREARGKIRAALAPDAGREILARLERAEKMNDEDTERLVCGLKERDALKARVEKAEAALAAEIDRVIPQSGNVMVARLHRRLTEMGESRAGIEKDRDRLKARVEELEDRLHRPVVLSEWQQQERETARLREVAAKVGTYLDEVLSAVCKQLCEQGNRQRSAYHVPACHEGWEIRALLEPAKGGGE